MAEMTGYENGTPSWVDIGTPDVQAAGEFYSALFGWDIEYGPAEMGAQHAGEGTKHLLGSPLPSVRFGVLSCFFRHAGMNIPRPLP